MSASVPAGDYSKHFTDEGLWTKLRRFAVTAGREVIEKVLTLYYTSRDPATPGWAKTVILSALGYFILPLDLIPDFVPGAGYGDDLGAVALAIAVLGAHVKKEHWDKARARMAEWFTVKSPQTTNANGPAVTVAGSIPPG